MKELTAAKLKEHRRPQQGERVEYQVMRIVPDCGQPWPTDAEIRKIQRKDTRGTGTGYGTHFAIRFTHKQMVPTPVLLAEAPGETAQAELREHNPFASRSTSTSCATLPTQGQAVCAAERDSPRVAGGLLRNPRRPNICWLKGRSVLRLTQWRRQPKINQCRRLVQLRLV